MRFGTVLLWTATVPSMLGAALGPLRADLVRVIQATTGGGWLARRGVMGTARVIECKYSASGWHPHAHTMLVFRNELTPSEVVAFDVELRNRYLSKADRLDVAASAEGQDVRRYGAHSDAVDYITKERVSPHGTDSASVLWDLVRQGVADALTLVHELESGTYRRRSWAVTGVCAPPVELDSLIARGVFDRP
ncbi:hypothetical protein [Microbacterium sp. NPDC055357]